MFVLSFIDLIVLTGTSFFTSALSAATGMGGGMLLFSVMTIYFPVHVLIPIHGIVQFFNNLFIVIFLRGHLRKDFILPFFWGSLIGIPLGAYSISHMLSTPIPNILMILLIAYTLFKPKKLPSLNVGPKNFFWVGLITAFFAMIAGAIDPVLAPFFIRDDLTKEEIIANKSFMQAIVHFAKVPVFYFLGFDYWPYLGLSLLINCSCIVGTKFGIILLSKINEKLFVAFFRYALIATGLRMIVKVAI